MEKQTKKKGLGGGIGARIIRLGVIVALTVGVAVGGIMIAISSKYMTEMAENEMIALAGSVSETVSQSVDSNFAFLEGLAKSELVYGRMDEAAAQKVELAKYAAEEGLLDLGVVGLDGMALAPDLVSRADISSRDYFIQAKAGNKYASEPIEDKTNPGNMIMMFAVPVYEGGLTSGKIIGVLFEKVEGDYLSNITNTVSFGDTGFAYLIGAGGTTIAYTSSEKVIEQENAIELFEGKAGYESLVACLKAVLANPTGYAQYTYNGFSRCVGYSTTIFNWHVIVSCDKDELFKGTQMSLNIGIIIILVASGLSSCVSLVMGKRMAAPLKVLEEVNEKMATGDLKVYIDDKYKKGHDEVANISNAMHEFVVKLKEVTGSTLDATSLVGEISDELHKLSEQSAEAAENVCKAVEDISTGNVSQAEDMEKAAKEVSALGEAVADIRTAVETLVEMTKDTEKVDNESLDALKELLVSNDKTTVAFNEISEQINETGVATGKISDAANLITEIASQTNLLSLNASIEAARAGEAGRGFAVVATEIQQLSEQSNQAADTIQGIINELSKGSEASIKKMQEALVLINEQQETLAKTRDGSNAVEENIKKIAESAKVINSSVEECETVKNSVNEIVMSLSAVSQENAASAEETNASMQELNANIGIMADSSKKLSEMSDKLQGEVSFWKI